MDHGVVLRSRRADAVLVVLALTLGMLSVSSGVAVAHLGPGAITSPRWQAKMYGSDLKFFAGPEIQLFDGLCKKGHPKREPCVPVTSWQRKAIEARAARLGVVIHWVTDPVVDSWDFWVFSPIRWDGRDAKYRFTIRQVSSIEGYGCKTRGNDWWRWSQGAWHIAGGESVTGCGDVWGGP